MQRYGMTIPFDGVPLHAQRDWIVELADLGYTDVWSSEANGADAFTPLALASTWAPSLRLGTPQKTTLPNGLRVWVLEQHAVPLVQLNVLVLSGASADPAGKFGAGSLTAAVAVDEVEAQPERAQR